MSLCQIRPNNPLCSLFKGGAHSVLYLPESVLDVLPVVGQAHVFPRITDFHVTTPLREASVKENPSLAQQGARMFCSEKFADKSGVFLIDTPGYTVLGFGRQLFSNFVEHRVKVQTDYIPIVLPCGEAIFKAACCGAHLEDAGFREAVQTIAFALKPEDIKNATRQLKQFNSAAWDQQSENAMMTTACLLASDPEFYAQLRTVHALVDDKPIHVIEFNPFDGIWGAKRPVAAALGLIMKEYDERQHGSLEHFVRSVVIGSDKNQLGKTWSAVLDRMATLEGGYAEFNSAVADLHVVRVMNG